MKNASSNNIDKQDNYKNALNTFKSESPIRIS